MPQQIITQVNYSKKNYSKSNTNVDTYLGMKSSLEFITLPRVYSAALLNYGT